MDVIRKSTLIICFQGALESSLASGEYWDRCGRDIRVPSCQIEKNNTEIKSWQYKIGRCSDLKVRLLLYRILQDPIVFITLAVLPSLLIFSSISTFRDYIYTPFIVGQKF